MKLSKGVMDGIVYSSDVVRDRIIEHRRWSVVHELIFRREGKLWRATYSHPATEGQDEEMWGYGGGVECVEVVEVPAVDYVPAIEQSTAAPGEHAEVAQ